MGGMEQSRAAKQQQEQMGLQRQLAELKQQQMAQQMEQAKAMGPLQQQLLEAQIGATQAKTAGLPSQEGIQVLEKQRVAAQGFIDAASKNPEILTQPGSAERYTQAINLLNQYPQMLQQMQMGQPQQQPMLPTDDAQEAPPNIIENVRFHQEQKDIPSDIKNQMIRSSSAKLMMGDVKKDLEKLKPYFGLTGSIQGAIDGYAASVGLSDNDTARLKNTLPKKIMALAGEVAAGMTKSRAESTIKEWQDIVNPITGKFVGFNQVMDNLNALEDIHNINHDALFSNYPVSKKRDEDFHSRMSEKYRSKDVPREATEEVKDTVTETPQYTKEEILAEIKRRGLTR
jgi:hypothetical protein